MTTRFPGESTSETAMPRQEGSSKAPSVDQSLRNSEPEKASLEVLIEALDAFADVALDHDALLAVVAKRAGDVIGDIALVNLLSDDGQWLRPSAMFFPDPALADAYRAMLLATPARAGEGRAGQVIEQNEPLLVPVVEPELMAHLTREEWRGVVRRLNIHSLLIVPMRVRGVPIGSFTLFRNRPGHPYGEREQTLLQHLADRAALAVSNARAHAAVKESAARSQREADERFRHLVESVKDYAIFVLDPSGHVITWNIGAERIKGYKASEIIGKHFSTFYPPDEVAAGKCEQVLEIAAREGRYEEEGWRLRQDRSRLWANVTLTALRNSEGVLTGFAKVTQDLTHRREAEIRLRQLAAETAALAEKARIQEFQERFLAILGHDLRNPLASIAMGSELLRQQAANNPVTLRVLDRMGSSSQRMSRMIEQILDLTRSRLAGGLTVSPQPMDLRDALSAIIEELRTAHPTRSIELHCPPLPGCWDRDRLEQVFSNIIGNAISYGTVDKPVTVHGYKAGEQVRVDLHNDGPPIPEELRAKIFHPFRRGERDSRATNTAGLGLGLYISHEIVAAHGGELHVRSSEQEGTTFSVTLPLKARATPSGG